MEKLQEDIDPGSYIAMCWVCEGYLCFDPGVTTKSNMPFGKVWDTPCPGAPPDKPAARRDIMDVEAAGGYFVPKGYDPVIPYTMNWDDPEMPGGSARELLRRMSAK
jgi:hypothetical protein